MTFLRVTLAVFLGLGFLCIAHALYYYPQLPDVVASHFGAAGRPDNWSGRNVFVGIYLVSVVMNGLIFLAIAYGIRTVPESMLNLPNKDFWLSPAKRTETYRFFFSYFLWFGSATFLLLLDMFHQTFMVHIGRTRSLGHPWLSILLYLAISVAWCAGLMVKFFRKPRVAGEEIE